MDKENKLTDINRLDFESDYTKAVPQKIMSADGNPNGTHLYIEQRAYIAKVLQEQGYGNVKQAVKEFAEKLTAIFDRIEDHCLEMHDWQGQSAVCECRTALKEKYKELYGDDDK